AREGDVRLELDAARGEHSHLDSTLHRKAEEGSLADPGLAADDQRRAAPKAGVGERPLYGRHLPVATEQHPTGMLWRRPPHNQGGPDATVPEPVAHHRAGGIGRAGRPLPDPTMRVVMETS